MQREVDLMSVPWHNEEFDSTHINIIRIAVSVSH